VGFLPDSLRPKMLVEPGVNSHILGSHLFFGKLLDLLDGPGSSILEADAVEALVQVDGVLAGHHLAHGGALTLLFALFGRHLEAN
jgi:hypothetical protein